VNEVFPLPRVAATGGRAGDTDLLAFTAAARLENARVATHRPRMTIQLDTFDTIVI